MHQKNNIIAIARYFNVEHQEFSEFWKSLTEEEKEYYRNTELDGESETL